MNKALKNLCVIAAVASLIAGLSACGGSDKSGAGLNSILGALPKMYAEHIIAKETEQLAFEKRLQTETENMGDEIDHEALARIHEEHEKAVDERDAVFQETVNAEWKKVSGKKVPFTLSNAFKELKLNVSEVKINGENQSFDLAVTAKEDITISWDNNKYKEIWYHVLSSDGSVITEGAALLVTLAHMDSATFVKGKNVKPGEEGGYMSGSLDLLRNTGKWIDFASLKFIDSEERILPDTRPAILRR